MTARARAAALACAAAVLLAPACDGLLVEPSQGPAAPATMLSLSLGPLAQAVPDDQPDNARVQVTGGSRVLLDTIAPFVAGTEEIVLPLRLDGPEGIVTVRVELRNGFRPLLRGSTDVDLLEERVTDAEVSVSPTSVEALAPLTGLSTGIYHSCATLETGQAYCWGINDGGQLGDGTLLSNPVPARVRADGTALRDVRASYVTTCGLDAGGRALCWGTDRREALGNGSPSGVQPTPGAVAGDLRFTVLSVGGLHACGLTAAGQAYCWGFNEFGQLGDGSEQDRSAPTRVDTGLAFRALSAGYLHTCGIATDGLTYCWGLNEDGQLGDGSGADHTRPTPVAGNPRFSSLSAGGLHTCAVGEGGTPFCWGDNSFGQLGTGTDAGTTTPAAVPGLQVREIAAGGLHSCALDAGSRAVCWGYNRAGAVGDGTTTDRQAPTAVADARTFRTLRAGLHHSCGIDGAGAALCWGYNGFGQIGDGTRVSRLAPVEVLDVDAFFQGGPSESSATAGAVGDLLRGRVEPL